MTIVLTFTLFLVSLNTKIASVEQGLEIAGCTLRETIGRGSARDLEPTRTREVHWLKIYVLAIVDTTAAPALYIVGQ